jgi:hypothetical protein
VQRQDAPKYRRTYRTHMHNAAYSERVDFNRARRCPLRILSAVLLRN